MVSDIKIFHVFPISAYIKHVTPAAGPFWPQGHNLNKLGRDPLVDASYQISRLQTRRFLKFPSRKSIFSLCDLDMKRTRTIWATIKEGHKRIIPAKFGPNPASNFGGDVLWSNCWRRTTHEGRRTSNDHNSSPWANGPGELKSCLIYVRKQKTLEIQWPVKSW